MNDKLHELTSRIYQEGISRGKEDARRIREEAEKTAGEIIEKANAEAERIVNQAKKEATELKRNTLAELHFSARQAINSLKQEIAELIASEAVINATRGSLSDHSFMNEVIITLARNWRPDSNNLDLMVMLPAGKQKEIEEYFNRSARDLLERGMTLKFSDGMEKGFEIGPGDGSYTIGFTDSDFEGFLREYLRPRMISLLFRNEETGNPES